MLIFTIRIAYAAPARVRGSIPHWRGSGQGFAAMRDVNPALDRCGSRTPFWLPCSSPTGVRSAQIATVNSGFWPASRAVTSCRWQHLAGAREQRIRVGLAPGGSHQLCGWQRSLIGRTIDRFAGVSQLLEFAVGTRGAKPTTSSGNRNGVVRSTAKLAADWVLRSTRTLSVRAAEPAMTAASPKRRKFKTLVLGSPVAASSPCSPQ
jgi:hypothetical protein